MILRNKEEFDIARERFLDLVIQDSSWYPNMGSFDNVKPNPLKELYPLITMSLEYPIQDDDKGEEVSSP